ncbi:MAG TPA: non-homologous end-joining DNA ligase [Thermoanaerobaculia bacterium]|nr:non-homologous end-joining DNA ligase [Thermoanaerobaculia bacterium]
MTRKGARGAAGLREPLAPMLATLVDEPFRRAGWVNEEKYDGYRALAYKRGARVKIYSRNAIDRTADFAEIAAALGKLDGDFVLDGEIVAFDAAGVSRFQRLQRRELGERVPLVYAIFDCLEDGGESLLSRSLSERRRRLERIVPARRRVLRRSRRLSADGLEAFAAARASGWEGIVSKSDDSRYEPGTRSRNWLKVKVRKESEFVIGGWTEPGGSREHFGALLVGLFEGQKLRYAGKVGTGYSHKILADVSRRFRPSEVCPFETRPKEKGAHWVRPELVAQLGFTEWTEDGKLRHPTFLGLRADKAARELRWRDREK